MHSSAQKIYSQAALGIILQHPVKFRLSGKAKFKSNYISVNNKFTKVEFSQHKIDQRRTIFNAAIKSNAASSKQLYYMFLLL